MRISSFISFIGFAILIVASYCPVLHVIFINRNVYQLNKPYALMFLLVAVLGLLGTVLNNIKLTRLAAWLSLILVVLFYIGALLKIHTSFSFIPLSFVAKYLAKQVTFRWGWYLLCTGPVFAWAGIFANRSRYLNKKSEVLS